MKIAPLKVFQASVLAAAVIALASCGGGGDIAGDNAEFSTSPDEFTIKVFGTSTGDCSNAYGSEVFVTIVGGQPPYRIQNSKPSSVRIDRTEATGKDPVFKVTSLGGCLSPATILVLDYHSQTATFEFNVEAEVPDTATTTPDE